MIPEGETGEGEGRAAPTPVSTTPYSASAKVWMAASKIPQATISGAGSGTMRHSLPPCVPCPPGPMTCGGG